jgi:hypothetical protein
MTRKTHSSEQSDEQLKFDFDLGQHELISASNHGLLFAESHQLALIDVDGRIVKRGAFIEKAVFRAIYAQLAKSFRGRSRGLTDDDF